MSEDRTQPPSKRRREQAREQGQAAQSPELTAAVGWLVAVVVLGGLGESLGSSLADLVRDAMSPCAMPADPAVVAARIRGFVFAIIGPLGAILTAFWAGALAAHQLQVRGLFATCLIAPDPARLWTPGTGPGLSARSGSLAWAFVKSLVVLVISAWFIRAEWREIQGLSGRELGALVRAASGSMFRLSATMAGVFLVLGLVDFGLRYARFENLLRTTAQEQREDQRVIEGDPAARAQRRRLARSWRGDAPELLAGASLMLTGPGGLTVILSGGPPPRRVTIRTAASGEPGRSLRRSADTARIPALDAPDLARRLARRFTPGSTINTEQMADIAAVWPGQRDT